MKKKITRIFIWLAGIFVLLLAIFSAILYIYQDDLKAAVVTEVNQMLAEPVAVKSVDVSVRKFPYASLVFEEVFTAGANSTPGDTLLFAKKIYFEFHLWNIFSDELKIRKISFEGGSAKIIRLKSSTPNYQIWKTDSSSSGSQFTLEEVSFSNFRLYQYEEAATQKLYAYLFDLHFSGSFNKENFLIQTNATMRIDSLIHNNITYLHSLNNTLAATIAGNAEESKITKGNLAIEGITIEFDVAIDENEVLVSTRESTINLEKIKTLNATQNWGLPKDINYSGLCRLNFVGSFVTNQSPDILLGFKILSPSSISKDEITIHDISCVGSYSLKNDQEQLSIKQFSGKGKTGSITGDLFIKDLESPLVVLNLKSDLALEEWLIFSPSDTISNPQGNVLIDIHFENHFKSFQNIKPSELRRAKASGSIVMKELNFGFKNSDKEIRDLNGNLSFEGNDLRVHEFFCKTGTSDIYLEGQILNIFNYLYFDDQNITIKTKFRSKQLVLEDLLISGSTSEEYSLKFAETLRLDLNLQVDRFMFKNFDATTIKGDIQVMNGDIRANSVSLKADDGNFTGNFSIIKNEKGGHDLDGSLNAKAVNIHDFFESCNNFSQTALVANNIYGDASFSMQLSCSMSETLEIDLGSIALQSFLTISNGNLKNYEPMLALSDYADLKELKDVRFSTLSNNIDIVHSKVIIPKMKIESNVMDMELEGIHGFDNVIDYSIRLKLSDVLFKKRQNNKKQSEFDEHLVEIENEDNPTIYIHMTGSVDDPKIELDSERMAKSVGEGIKQESKQLKELFKKKDKTKKEDNAGLKFDLFGEEDDPE